MHQTCFPSEWKQKCANKFNMQEFRTEYSKYRTRQRIKKIEAKKKNPEGFKNYVNKRKQKYKSRKKGDPQVFKSQANISQKKYETNKKKAEDPEGFKNDANK